MKAVKDYTETIKRQVREADERVKDMLKVKQTVAEIEDRLEKRQHAQQVEIDDLVKA